MNSQSAATAEVVEKVGRRIANIAAHYALVAGVEKEDLIQDMWVAILEKCMARPDFLEQAASYIANIARGTVISQRTTMQRCFDLDVDPMVWKAEDGTMEDLDVTSTGAFGNIQAEEDDLILAELLKDLPTELRDLALLLSEGFSKAEAARLLGISRQLVNYRVKLLASRLA